MSVSFGDHFSAVVAGCSYCWWGVPRDGAVSGARSTDGLLRPAGSPVVGVFCEDVLFLLPLTPVFGGLASPDLVVLALGVDCATAAIGRSAIAAARMMILFMALPS